MLIAGGQIYKHGTQGEKKKTACQISNIKY